MELLTSFDGRITPSPGQEAACSCAPFPSRTRLASILDAISCQLIGHDPYCAGKMRANPSLDTPVKALCVFFEQAIHIHFPGLGEQVEMDLPFRFSKAFPAPTGFLIQRQIESEMRDCF